jgi:hypothetical protein
MAGVAPRSRVHCPSGQQPDLGRRHDRVAARERTSDRDAPPFVCDARLGYLPAVPEPAAELRCGPIWTRAQIEEYIGEIERVRSMSFLERLEAYEAAKASEGKKPSP